MGIAVISYLQDNKDKYPYYLAGSLRWEGAIEPYYKLGWYTNNSFQCPSIVSAPAWDGTSVTYAYNRRGTDNAGGYTGAKTFLGLGNATEGSIETDWLPPISASQVRVPSDMFAIADSRVFFRVNPQNPDQRVAIDYMESGMLTGVSNEVTTPRHGTGYNILYCDGHVALVKRLVFLDPSKSAVNWNNDHEPHAETWLNPLRF
jgi:prepilin-type processing-associated H-X9-DG protein